MQRTVYSFSFGSQQNFTNKNIIHTEPNLSITTPKYKSGFLRYAWSDMTAKARRTALNDLQHTLHFKFSVDRTSGPFIITQNNSWYATISLKPTIWWKNLWRKWRALQPTIQRPPTKDHLWTHWVKDPTRNRNYCRGKATVVILYLYIHFYSNSNP